MTKNCIRCGTEFIRNGDSNKRWATRKYCSRKCNDIHKRGMESLPRKTKLCQVCGKEYEKPYELSWKEWVGRKFCGTVCGYQGRVNRAPKTAFKPGNKPHNFKEKGYSYDTVHHWLSRHYKKKGVCDLCKEERKTQWANKTGKYKRDRDDYYELCYSCHTKFDKNDPKRPTLKHGPVVDDTDVP